MQATDYSAFGVILKDREYYATTTDKYRFGGAGGQEKDDEIFVGAYTAEYWEFDSRLGRRSNCDLIVKPWESPYATLHNNPIIYIDPDGLDPRYNIFQRIKNWIKGDSYKNTLNKMSSKIDKKYGVKSKVVLSESGKKSGREFGYVSWVTVDENESIVHASESVYDRARWVSRDKIETTLGIRVAGKPKFLAGIGADVNLVSAQMYSRTYIHEPFTDKKPIIEKSGVLVDNNKDGIDHLNMSHGAGVDILLAGISVEHSYQWDPQLSKNTVSDINTEVKRTILGITYIKNSNPDNRTRPARSVGLEAGDVFGIMGIVNTCGFVGMEYYDK